VGTSTPTHRPNARNLGSWGASGGGAGSIATPLIFDGASTTQFAYAALRTRARDSSEARLPHLLLPFFPGFRPQVVTLTPAGNAVTLIRGRGIHTPMYKQFTPTIMTGSKWRVSSILHSGRNESHAGIIWDLHHPLGRRMWCSNCGLLITW